MSAATPAPAAQAPTVPASPLDGIRLTFGGLLRSEWIKLRTLRSTMWCLAALLVVSIGIGLLLAFTITYTSSSSDPSGTPGANDLVLANQKQIVVQAATIGVNFTQLIAAVLGVLVISGEYGTGMIRSTFTAAPGRLAAFAAKGIVLGLTLFVAGVVSIGLTALLTSPVLAAKGIDWQLGSPDVLLPLLGGAGYLALIALLAFALGAIIRNTAGGLATIFGLLLVVPTIATILYGITQQAWVYNLSTLLPSSAGGRMFAFTGWGDDVMRQMGGQTDLWTLPPEQGLLVMAIWVVVMLVIGALLLKRRDA